MITFNFQTFAAKHVVTRSPHAPSPDAQEHNVTLAAPKSDNQHFERDAWCRQNAQYQSGELWHGCRDPRTGGFVFSFSNPNTATLFALFFKGE